MAYKRDDNGGQAAQEQQKAAPVNLSTGGGSRDSSAHAAASADRQAAANRGPVTRYEPSVRGGVSTDSGAVSPAWVGKNPYEWGNTTSIVNHWDDNDQERQAKLNALGFAADDPDRTFHYYAPDKGADKSYLEQANALSTDRNYYQAGNFWNTINGQYASEEDRVSDAMEWMKDAQIYGQWAKEHGLTYTDENGEERSMEDAWKEIWSYANDIAGGIGDSASTRAGKEIDAYLGGGQFDSKTTQRLLDQAKQFGESADNEKDTKYWADYEKALSKQLAEDQKREKKENSFLGKASAAAGNLWDTFTGLFDRPEKEAVELSPEEQAEYDRLQADYREASQAFFNQNGKTAAQSHAEQDRMNELEQQIKTFNREHGRKVYDGLAGFTTLGDVVEGVALTRPGTIIANAGALLSGIGDSPLYISDEHRQLANEQAAAQRKALATLDPEDMAEADRLATELDAYEKEHREEIQSPVGDAAEWLLDKGSESANKYNQAWEDVTEDMSPVGRTAANVGKAFFDVVSDATANAGIKGAGTFMMYMSAGGSEVLKQMDVNPDDPDAYALASIKGMASAYLSNRIFGGMEDVYGKSVFGQYTDDLIKNCRPEVQTAIKTFVNSEGAEEGMEDILNWAGDIIFSLDEESKLKFDEVGMDSFVGYVCGVLTNGLTSGMEFDTKARHRIAEDGVKMVLDGMTPEEVVQVAMENSKEDVVMKPQPEANTEGKAADLQAAARAGTNAAWNEQAASQNAALEGQETTPQVAPAQTQAASGPTANTSKPYEGPTLPGASYGGEARVKVGNTKIPVHFAVVPISELNVSHDIYGNQNQNYPVELQPRDRSRGTAQNQAIQIGTNLDPEELEWSNNATTGAPIIRPDGTVISGNGRTLGISYALQSGRGSDYIQHIRDNASRFGIDPNSIGEDSVLVRVADGDYNWQAMAEQANVSDVSRMSATEQAGVDAERLSRYPEILSKLVPNDTGDLNTSDNADFVKDFLQAVVPASEQGDVWTEEGGFSQSGMRRVQNAIFQMAYGDAGLMSRLSESLDNNMKNVSNSMLALAPKVAALENNVENGTRYIGIRDAILDGVKIFETAKNRGVEVGKVVDQISMDGNASAEAVFIAEFLQDNAKSAKQIRTFLNDMADTAESFGDPTQIGFFDTGDTEYTSRDVLEGAIAKYEQETGRKLGRPDYDFYGDGSDAFNLGADRESESGTPAEADAVAGGNSESAGEAAGSGADARVSELGKRMLAGEVSDEEYLSLIDSEEGRAQLAEALGIRSTDKKDVAAGLSIYLLYQDQLRQSINQNTQTDETVVDNLLGTEPEEATETATEAQETPADVNSQPEETNAPESVLNAQEAEESSNPFFETEETTEPEPRNVNENVDTQRNETPQNRREKVSQYFTNTLTESGRAKGLDPVTYNPTSEAESLTNAAMRLAQDQQAVLDQLMSSPAWNGELVDAAWMLENEFYKEFVTTGNRTNWDAWRKLETYKISETAKGLQAVAKQSRPGAAGVLEASLNQLADFKAGGSKASQAVSEAEVAQAEKDVNAITRRMAEIENEIDQRTENGMDETEARAMSKEAYLDLAEKINKIRNTGKMFFGGKRKFRNMLGSQDMDFIQRFVACQAAGIAEDVNYKGKQDRLKQLNTFQKLAQLTGTGTWSRNLQGNATFGAIDLLANNGVAVAVDQIVGKITGQRSTGFELGALSRDARAASKRALDRSILEVAANIDLAENSAMEGYDLSRTRTFDPNGNIVERVLSRWEQWNGYMLNSSDKFFRGGTEESVTRAIARANGWDVNNLTAEQRAQIQQTAQQVADYRLFQNNGVAAEAADSIREGLNKLGAKAVGRTYERGQFGLGTALTPYTKVPTNIGVKALEFSPAGAAKGFAEIVRTARDSKAGKATMAQQNQAVTDFARGVTGTALIVGLAQLMKNWPFFKDWENEDDKDVLAQNRAEGKSGMQFNIDMMLRGMNGDEDTTWRNGDRTIDISSIEPANQLMTAASLIAEGLPAQQAILQSAKENFMQLPSVSALANIENTIKYTDTPDDLGQTLLNTAASTAGSVASGFIPAPIRHGTTVADEYARDTSGNNARERAVNQFKASVPGLRETLPVKTDNYGNEISSGDLGTRLLNTYGGNRYTQINQNDISREAERLWEATGEKLTPSRNAPSSEKFGDEKVKFTAEERKSWKDDYGQGLDDAVGLLMRSSIYRDADDELKAQLWQNLEGYVKDGVKREFAEDHDLKHDSKYAYLDDVDNPITFLTTKKAFDVAEEGEKWDVVDTLVGPVGKLTEDEQELMREKNRTLMSYYDYLTPNDRGYKVKDAETVHSYKEAASANASARGVQSASGMDKYSAVVAGYRDRKYTDDDVDAFMTKQASDGDWEVTKGRAALYLAARAGGASVREAFDVIDSADVDQSGSIDEKGYTQKAKHEGTNALKRAGISDQNAMWDAFNEVMYNK